ncbi:Uma2 family endonuclease [Desulfosporosinus sp. FKA]|uniref:Uma2 family endonuclease n=1 Tax=Desulfosporosinus sp. FKA TaxID=1969834 RepID=UPI001A9A68D7|nr:Uma2 family endonuclease [Desulfosporosinus sp. FKA]
MVNIANQQNKIYNYKDYLNWSDDRIELIEGQIYAMTPAPSRLHQKVLGNLFFQIKGYLQDKNCDVYIAPFDVRLKEKDENKDEEITTVVQPDLVIVCDPSKLDDRGCNGSPDLIVEVVSPSTASMDYIRKLELYEKFGVKEYWIVQPIDQVMMAYRLNTYGNYERAKIYDKTGSVRIEVLEGLEVDLLMMFEK